MTLKENILIINEARWEVISPMARDTMKELMNVIVVKHSDDTFRVIKDRDGRMPTATISAEEIGKGIWE